MMNRKIEIAVGFFIVLVISSLLFICLRVVDPSSFSPHSTYRIYAVFDNIGGLKIKSPVKIGGVVIGRVSDIHITYTKDDVYKPYVTLDLQAEYNKIPSSSSLMIKTSGLLGEQFIEVRLGLDQHILDDIDALTRGSAATSIGNAPVNDISASNYFQDGSIALSTKSALDIEDLIGQFLYNSNGSDDKKDKKATSDNNNIHQQAR